MFVVVFIYHSGGTRHDSGILLAASSMKKLPIYFYMVIDAIIRNVMDAKHICCLVTLGKVYFWCNI